LTVALSTFLRLFAPILPYVTDEVWSWWQDGSVHKASWPTGDEVRNAAGAEDAQIVLDAAAAVTAEVRRAKTEAKVSLRADVTKVTVRDTSERLAALHAAEADVKEAGHIAELVTEEGPELSVDVELAPN
jgi:valyl-tRNA synthetase